MKSGSSGWTDLLTYGSLRTRLLSRGRRVPKWSTDIGPDDPFERVEPQRPREGDREQDKGTPYTRDYPCRAQVPNR